VLKGGVLLILELMFARVIIEGSWYSKAGSGRGNTEFYFQNY